MADAPSGPDNIEVIDLTELSDGSSEGRSDHERSEDSDEESPSDTEHSDDDDVVVDADTRVEVRKAVATLPEAKLREIMLHLIERVPAVEYAMTREFVTRKRKQGLIPCTKCEEEYDEYSARQAGECMVHPGHLRPNYESFADWDEDVHGPIDSLETQQEYPENFLWTCCKQDGTTYGCVHGGTHEPVSQSKRRRLRE